MSLKHPRNMPRQHGSMLISVLFIMVVLGALMAAIATLTSQSSQQLVYEVQALKARLVAEAVLEKEVFTQLNKLNTDKVHIDEDGKRLELSGCTGYIVQLDDSAPNKVNVIASGTCTTGELTVIRNIEVEVIEDEN